MKAIDIFPWDEHFNTGLATVDEQHHRLVELLNQLAREVAFKSDLSRLNEIFDELLDYTVYHFETEELIWAKYFVHDPMEKQHKAVHQQFIDTVVRLKGEQSLRRSIAEVAEETLGFLARWLTSHILETDRTMAYIVLALQEGMDMESAKKYAMESMSGFTRTLIDLILLIYETLSTNTLQLMYEIRKQNQLEIKNIELQNQLNIREEYQRTLLDNFPFVVWFKNTQGQYLTVNEPFSKLCGYDSPVDIIGKTDLDIWPLDLAESYCSDDSVVIKSRVAKNIEELVETDENRIWLETYKSAVIVDGKVMGTVGFSRDITARKESEANLRLAASVFAHSREGILITAEDGTIIEVNNAFTRITGYGADEVIGKNPSLLKSGRQGNEFYTDLWSRLTQKGHWYGEVWNRRKNGEVYAELLTISTIFQEDGAVKNYVALFSDISTIKDHEKQLEHIAHYDALTGLANRVLLSDRLEQAMIQTSRRGGHLAVVYLDLDGFKDINDRYGHEAGDQLLMAIAANMKLSLREGDTLSRLGGDEFVAVLLDLDDLEASNPTLTRLLNAASQNVEYEDMILSVSASLGVTFYPQSEEIEADQLLRQADQAMYQAKQAGKNRFHLFDTQQDFTVRAHHENVEGIRYALKEEQFVLYYQPKVNMRTGEILGVEALIRWQHPTQGILPPAVFLPVIEDHPLAIDLGEWVINTALTQIEIWQSMGIKIPISINIGARQLQQNDFIERLKFLLGLHPSVSPSMLELEVLETSALEDMSKITNVMKQCKKLGIDFALDDFGTGYSSLTYLKHLPVSLLKIDQSFIRDMLHDPDDLAILEGVIGLGIAFRRNVIAEGVETLEHGKMLLQLGCEWAQGYGISYPMPASNLPEWIASWRPDPSWLNRTSVSRDEVQILYAMVVHQGWINEMETFLKDGYAASPVLNPHECRFGEWLDCEHILKSSNQSSFLVIQELHERVHTFADELCDLKKHNHQEEAIAKIGELHALRDSLHEKLMALISE